jgi:hypothetical protein
LGTPVRATSAALFVLTVLPLGAVRAQQLTPNAYAPSPVGVNVAILSDAYSFGDVSFDPSLPVDDVHATINAMGVGYGRTFGLFGRYANAGFVLPYVDGELSGLYLGQPQSIHPTGFGDPQFRLGVNLYGAPAMTPREFAVYTRKTIFAVSLIVVPPLGKYDSSKLINIGSNRWSFKPELAYSRSNGAWTLEADAGAWLFTNNRNFARGKVRSQDPVGALQLHAIYALKPQLWVSLDGTYYSGGRTSINGHRNFDLQANSRVGFTLALPLNPRHSLKFAYSHGAVTRIGGDFDTIGVSYQYAWLNP